MWLNTYCNSNLLNDLAQYNRLRQIFIAELVRFGRPYSKQKKQTISNQVSPDFVKSREAVKSRLVQWKDKKSNRRGL